MSFTFTETFLRELSRSANAEQLAEVNLDSPWAKSLRALASAADHAANFVPKLTPRQLDLALVDRLVKIESGLTDWEVKFIDSLVAWLASNDCLTGPQRIRAEGIDMR